MGQKLFLTILSKGKILRIPSKNYIFFSELKEVEVRICVRPNFPIINLILFLPYFFKMVCPSNLPFCPFCPFPLLPKGKGQKGKRAKGQNGKRAKGQKGKRAKRAKRAKAQIECPNHFGLSSKWRLVLQTAQKTRPP